MSVERFTQGTDLHDMCADQDGHAACFFCGETLSGHVVCWMGTSLIGLHPTCAYELSHELIGDARNAIRVIEGKPLSAGVNSE